MAVTLQWCDRRSGIHLPRLQCFFHRDRFFLCSGFTNLLTAGAVLLALFV